jgi:hypothetical protein
MVSLTQSGNFEKLDCNESVFLIIIGSFCIGVCHAIVLYLFQRAPQTSYLFGQFFQFILIGILAFMIFLSQLRDAYGYGSKERWVGCFVMFLVELGKLGKQIDGWKCPLGVVPKV